MSIEAQIHYYWFMEVFYKIPLFLNYKNILNNQNWKKTNQ